MTMTSIAIPIVIRPKMPVSLVAEDMIALAKRLDCTVEGYKGSVRLWATPRDDDPQRIVDYYLSVAARS